LELYCSFQQRFETWVAYLGVGGAVQFGGQQQQQKSEMAHHTVRDGLAKH